MKHYLITIILILSANLLAATTHTYLYTFNSNPFPIPTTSWQTSYLNNLFIKTSYTTAAPTLSYITDSGLCIKPGVQGTQFYLSHKQSRMHINYIKLNFYHSTTTGTTDNIYFYSASAIIGSVQPHTTSSYTVNYPDSSSMGFKIEFHILEQTILKSIEISYTDSNTNPDITLSDRGSVIGSLCATTQSDPLPSLPSPSTQFDFYGWTTSSTLYNSPTASCTNYIPTTSTTLYSCYSHPRPKANSTPSILKLSNNTNPTTLAEFTFTPSSDIHLTSACFNLKRELTNDNPVTLKAETNGITFADTLLDHTYVSKTSFNYHTLFADAIIPVKANTAVTFKADQAPGSTNCDTLLLSYYADSQLDSRFYTNPPSFDALHIHLTDSTPLSSVRTALDDLSYTMTIDDSRYYFFSLPFAVPFSNITFSPISGPIPLTYYSDYVDDHYVGDWVISRYDEHNNEWIDMTESDLSAGLQPYVGYTIGLSQPCTTAVTFRSTYAPDNAPHSISPDQPSQTLSLSYTSTNQPKDRGWNLIGNPYYTPLSTLNIPANYILIPQPNSTTYHIIHKYAETLTDTTLAPFSSFFIQSTSSSITLNPQSVSARAVTATQPHHFNLLCTDPTNNYTSCLTILASDSYTEDYEIGLDLKSLSPYDDITHDGLAIYAAPLGVGDTVTFSLPSGCSKDNLSLGSNISIPSSWHINIIDDSHLVIEDTTPTDIDDIEDVPGIVDAPIDIEDVSHIYTMDGKLLPTTDFSTLPSGIYILIINNRPHKILKQ